MNRSSLKDAEIAAEQRHVDLAYARLEEMRAETRQLLRDSFRIADAGTRAALVDRDAMVHQTALRAHTLDHVHEELVFGRLDMRDGERLYIGRLGIRTKERDSLVIDWRAPAAEPFYRATPEDPMGVVRRRVLHCRGEQVRDIEDDLLDPGAMPADMPIVGDGAFLAALSRTRDGTMRDIVATIQREQDEVVRAPVDGSVIVSGGPGTGKTAVALHRVAWLLFRHRKRFGSRGVLVVGPNPRFINYIERVLPSLGEEGVTLRSLGGVVGGVEATSHDDPATVRIKGSERMVRVLRRAVADAPPDAPTELRVTHRGTVVRLGAERLAKIRQQVNRKIKRRPNLARAEVAAVLLDAAWQRMAELGTDVGTLPPDRAEFLEDVGDQRAFHEFLAAWWPRRHPVRELRWLGDPERLARAARGVLDPVEVDRVATALAHTARTGKPTFADVALIDELDVLLGRPRGRRGGDDAGPGDEPGGDAFEVEAARLAHAAGPDAGVADGSGGGAVGAGSARTGRRGGGQDGPPDLFVVDGFDLRTGEDVSDDRSTLRELTTYGERLGRDRRGGDGAAGTGRITRTDAVAGGDADRGPGADGYAHIVIDEAQDLSPMQWRMLGRRGRHATWTVVADAAQSAWEDEAGSRTAMDDALGDRRRHEFELTTNYRNPVEIAEVAAGVLRHALPGARVPRAVRTAGHRPRLRAVSRADLPETVRAAATDLLGDTDGAVAVISAMTRRMEVGDWTIGLGDRVQAMGSLEAKGLEFDAVVLVDPGEIAAESPAGLRTLYVVLTRATQRLVVAGPPDDWPSAMPFPDGVTPAR